MRSPTPHPDEIPVRHSLPKTRPNHTAVGSQADPATSERRWLPLWREQQESAGARAWEWGLWPVLGGILLLVGVIAFFRFLAAAEAGWRLLWERAGDARGTDLSGDRPA